MSVEAPSVTSSQVSGAVVETFRGFETGALTGVRSTALGTLTATGTTVEAAGPLGSPTGKGNHLQTDAGSTSIVFADPVAYFGVWLTSAAPGTRLHFNTVGGKGFFLPLDAILSTDWSGKASSGNLFATTQLGDLGQPSAFVNLFATDPDSRITRITLSGTSLTSDNYSIATNLTLARGQILASAEIIPNPEPATIVQLAIGAISLLGYGWKRGRRTTS
ncbi:MAG: hypothetical protein U0746_21430 [Gemmataceae bacterium]